MVTTDKDKDKDKDKDEKDKIKSFKEEINQSFLEKRQIFLWGAVHDKSAQEIVEKLLYLEYNQPNTPIYFFINSPGGVITAGMAIYDVIKMISSPVYTISMGIAASMGAMLFAIGEKGHRYVFANTKVMIHQPLISGQIIAPAIDIKIHAEQIKKTRNDLNKILSDSTGQSLKKIEEDTDRDYYLNAKECLSYGIADKMITNINEVMPKKIPTREKRANKTTPSVTRKKPASSTKKKK